MIIPVVVAGLVGFLAAGRTQPQTRCEKKVVLGSRTGRTYQVEEFPQAGFLVVRAPDAYGVFQHVTPQQPGDARFSWRGGKGPAESLHGMCWDLGLVKDSPAGAGGRESGVGQSGSGSGSSPSPEPRTQSPEPRAQNPEPSAPSARPRPTAVPSPQKTGS